MQKTPTKAKRVRRQLSPSIAIDADWLAAAGKNLVKEKKVDGDLRGHQTRSNSDR